MNLVDCVQLTRAQAYAQRDFLNDDEYETFYLAGSWRHKSACAAVAERIEDETDLYCMSRWLHSDEDDDDPDARRAGAVACMEDVENSDVVLVLTQDRASLGKHVELGLALALGKHVILVRAPWANPFSKPRCAFYELCSGPMEVEDAIKELNS